MNRLIMAITDWRQNLRLPSVFKFRFGEVRMLQMSSKFNWVQFIECAMLLRREKYIRTHQLGTPWLQSQVREHFFPVRNTNSKPLQTLKGFYSNEVDFPFDHLQMSSEADIFRIRSAHEYYQLVEYELPTPPLLGDTRGQIFSVLIENPPNTIVNGRS